MPTPSRTATPPRTTRTPAENCTVADARARGIRRYADLRRSAGRDSPRRRAPRLPRARNAQPRRSALSRMPGREPSAITQISATVRPGCPPHCAPRLPPPRTRATAEICTIADARARGIRNCADLRHTAAPMTHLRPAPQLPRGRNAQPRTSARSRMPGRQASAITQISATVQHGCPTPTAPGIHRCEDLRTSPDVPPRRRHNCGHLHCRGCPGARHPQLSRSPPQCRPDARRAPQLPRARRAQPRTSTLSRMPGREASVITQISAAAQPRHPAPPRPARGRRRTKPAETRDRPGHAPARAYRPCQAGLLANA